MTTAKQLSRNYDALSRSDRAALCFHALGRGDDTEFQRLCDSAEQQHWSAPDHTPIMTAVATLGMQYLAEQLFHALNFWFSIGQSAIGILGGESDGEKRQLTTFDLMGEMSAYLYVTNRESWVSFCDELGIEPEHLGEENFQPLLQTCDEYLSNLAPSREELIEMVSSSSIQGLADAHEPENIATVEDMLDRWRSEYARLS